MNKLTSHPSQGSLPSTSKAAMNTASPLFNPHQLIHASPPAAIQAMANTIFSPNPFFNPAFPLAAFGSPTDLSRFQQWFNNQPNNTPIVSPFGSNAPSLANLSGLSLFTNDSTLTLNSQLSKTNLNKAAEGPDLNEPKNMIKFFLNVFSQQEGSNIVLPALKPLKMFVDAILNKRIPMNFDQKELCELIKLMICRLSLANGQSANSLTNEQAKLNNGLLEILATTSIYEHFKTVILEQPTQMLNIFVRLTYQAAANGEDFQQIIYILRIFYNALAFIKDKSAARTEQMFLTLLHFLQIHSANVKYFALGILRVLTHCKNDWKKFIMDNHGMEIILKIIEGSNRKLIRQAIRTMNSMLDSENTAFACKFVQLNGINLVITKVESFADSDLTDHAFALNCLRLVSDIPELAQIELHQAIHFALKCTLPLKVSKKDFDIYLENIENSLGFLRNAIAVNERGRNYLVSIDQGKSIPHLIGVATQSFQLIQISLQQQNPTEQRIDKKRQKMLLSILENCIAILSLVNKEDAKGKVTEEQRMASKTIAADALFLYQLLLNVESPALHKIILMSLLRISNAGVAIPLESQGLFLAETLLKYLFISGSNRLSLIKMAAEVLCHLVLDSKGLHLSKVTQLLMSNASYQLLKLLDSHNNVDFYLAILKLIKELCQRDPNLRTLWFRNKDNVNLLKCLMTTLDNREIVNLCTKIFEILEMPTNDDISEESAFYDIFTQGMELMDQSGLS